MIFFGVLCCHGDGHVLLWVRKASSRQATGEFFEGCTKIEKKIFIIQLKTLKNEKFINYKFFNFKKKTSLSFTALFQKKFQCIIPFQSENLFS